MPSRNNEEEEEEYEILDLSEYRNPAWLRQMLGDVSRQSAGKQLAVGGGAGWCAGYVFSKIGRVAAAAMGTSLILIQVAQYNGYININWNNVNRSVSKARQRLNRDSTRHLPRYLHYLQDFLQQNRMADRPVVLLDSLNTDNPEWGVRPEYADQFRDDFQVVWSKDVRENPELGKKVVAAVFNRGNDYGLLDKLDTVYPNLKIITSISVGVERVNIAAYQKRGIKICNSPGILDPVVGEFAVGLILAAARNIVKGAMYGIGPDVGSDYSYELNWVGGVPVSGATLGIIGMGRIGYSMAKKAFGGFDMKIIYYDKFRRSPPDEDAILATYYSDLHDMLRESDFVVTICPLTPETNGILGTAEFKVMKKSAIVINVGRGKLIKTYELAKAIEEGEIRGAALDVTEPEPLPRDHPILKLPNVIITPHIAGALLKKRMEMARLCANNIKAFLEGRPLLSEFKPL